MGQVVGREESCFTRLSESEVKQLTRAECRCCMQSEAGSGRKKRKKTNDQSDWQNRLTDGQTRPASDDLVRSRSFVFLETGNTGWQAGPTAKWLGWEGCVGGLAGWLAAGGMGWLGLWVLDFPLPRDSFQGWGDHLPDCPDSPQGAQVASAATKGEPPGEGSPQPDPPFPPSTLLVGPSSLPDWRLSPAGCTRLPSDQHGGSSSVKCDK